MMTMEAMRFVETPKDGLITIRVPDQLKSRKKLEIIVLPYENEEKKKKNFDPRKFKGAGKLNMTESEIDRECQKMRAEWDRDF